jgi:hypothetical protein
MKKKKKKKKLLWKSDKKFGINDIKFLKLKKKKKKKVVGTCAKTFGLNDRELYEMSCVSTLKYHFFEDPIGQYRER